jgi:DNA invertase Pin-like site-specific DNA recombinase
LYWTTQKQNTADGIAAGRINAKKRPNTKKLSKSQICEIAEHIFNGKGVNEVAIMLDFPRTTISSVLNGRSNWELYEFAMEELKTPKQTLDFTFKN